MTEDGPQYISGRLNNTEFEQSNLFEDGEGVDLVDFDKFSEDTKTNFRNEIERRLKASITLSSRLTQFQEWDKKRKKTLQQ